MVAGACGSDEGADAADASDSGASTTPLEGTDWVLAGDELGEPLGDIVVSALFSEGTGGRTERVQPVHRPIRSWRATR